MRYLILINGPPYGTQNAYTGFLFAKSVLKLHHKLDSIFFYCDGVLNANFMINPANDEFNIVNGWINLNNIYNISLNVCFSAAMRRGVVKNITNNVQYKKFIGNLHHCFKLTSLIKLGESLQKCDRCIQF
ncbi:sulfurtransferase complex subunit TusD [Buchnera aphidicola (Mollitrichosiphum nigrofasciatum)]|uniref:sulfurtransferase complex subunit TusD n=1 Tax=Buchnera aphidicola TaxID=9 RepID=UPI0031B890F3